MNGTLELKKIMLSVFLFLIAVSISAQGRKVSGTVKDADGSGLPGVTVVEKGTTNGVSTDLDGAFTLTLTGAHPVLVFSSIGYVTIEKSVAPSQTNLQIKMSEDVTVLDDVVVVGYGTVKRSTLTNAVSSVNSDQFVQGAVTSPLQLLQGKVAGLAINTTSGDPNDSGVQLMLRGVSTLTGNQQPLVVIDGVPGTLNNISVDDIETIDVLKDGSAAAIYGTRGTNGVILITTKKGSTGKATLSYHGYLSLEQISNEIDVLSPDEFRRLPELTDGLVSVINDGGANTVWKDKVFRDAWSHTHHISLQGGDAQTNYYASVNYRKREGIMKNTDQERTTFKIGLDRSFFDGKLSVGGDINYVIVKGSAVDQGAVYFATLTGNPTNPVYDANTGKYSTFYEVENPVRLINEYQKDLKWNEFTSTGKIVYRPIEELSLTALGSLRTYNNNNGTFATRNYDDIHDGQVWREAMYNESKTLELYGQYSKAIKQHDFSILGGYSYNDFEEQNFNLYNYNYPTDALGYAKPGLGMALKEGLASMDGHKFMNKLISFFGRVNYNYDEKYLFSGSLRYEGSSKFGKNHQWGLFYAASGAWRISQEKFMRNVKFVNELKLKVGYGVTGIEPTNPYQSHLRYAFGDPVLINGQWVRTVAPTENANPDLKWEEKHELNIGLDFALFKNRLSGSIDYYRRETRDLLYTYNVPVPPNLASTTLANVGTVENSGVEAVLSGLVVNNRDWKLNLTANFSYNTNKLKKLSNEKYQRDFLELGSTGAPVQKSTHLVKEGGAIGNFYGWKSIGMTESGEWVIEGGEYGDNSSRTVLGNGIPTMRAGFTAALSYKNFDLTVSLRGAFDYQILNQYRMLYETFEKETQYNYPKTLLDKVYGQYVRKSPAYVSYYIENGDYVKIDNVTLGYNFKLKSSVIQNLRVYLSGLNLYTFTGYKGVDPEVNFNGLTPGMDSYTGYPTTRTFSLGVKIGF